MSVNWDLFESKITATGETPREREVYQGKQDFLTYAVNHPGYRETTTRNGVSQPFLITQKGSMLRHESVIDALPGDELELGDMICFDDMHWLVTQIRSNSVIQKSGVITLCNHKFRWLDFDGKIQECWGVANNPYSRYSRPEQMINTSYSVFQCILPYNEHTNKIFVDQRFILWSGYNKDGEEIPYVFKVTSITKTTAQYGNNRLICIDVERVVSNPNDSIEEMIADYYQPTAEKPEDVQYYLELEGAGTVRMGLSSRTISAKLTSSEDVDCEPNIEWTVTLEDDSPLPSGITYTSDENRILLTVTKNSSLLGEVVKITATETAVECEPAVKLVEVI